MSIERMACSNAAGKYIFGETQSFEILENGIDVKKYRFDEKGRKEIRQRYKVSDDMVLLGFVGRLQYQKNPLFMLQVYNEYRRINNKSKLIIIGTGGLEMECRKYVEKNNLANSVIFAGYISNVYRYYSAMDALLLPSRFEGLAVTAVEAQAAGLTVFASDSIAPEHNIASLVNFISISEPATRWANMITSYTGDRFAKNEEVKNAGYDIQDVAKKLENYYIDLYKKME